MRILAIFGLLLMFSLPAHAAVLEFDAVQDLGGASGSYSEDGVTVSGLGGDVAYKNNPGKVYLADYGTAFASGLSIENGGRFDAVGFDYLDVNNNCFTPTCLILVPYDNIELSAYRDNVLVGSENLTYADGPASHTFGSDFMDIDRLVISVLSPTFPIGAFCLTTGEPCSIVELDNLELNPVAIAQTPLPAGLPLYAAGMGLIGLWMRRRRTK
ncbi:MAG: hypothetical protein MI743_20650 [Sneathiellales bacterium]|nr:hypothetical protein [Sneathiellales bacterium]